MNKTPSYPLLILLLAITIIYYLFPLNRRQPLPSFDPIHTQKIVEYKNGPYDIFFQADSLQWVRDYQSSISIILQILEENKALGEDLRLYGLNQLTFNYLMLDQLEEAGTILNRIEKVTSLPKQTTSADLFLAKGIFHQKTRKTAPAIAALRRAINNYSNTNYQAKQILAINELALTYKYYTFKVDSFLYYADQAYNANLSLNRWNPYTPKIYYSKAHACWIRRAHEEGQDMCDLAIEAASETRQHDSLIIARCLSLKGRFIRKDKYRIEEAERTLVDALLLGKAVSSTSPSKQILYQNLLAHYARKRDSTNLFLQLDSFKSTYLPGQWTYTDPASIRGLYYAHAKERELSIKWYNRFLKRHLERTDRQASLVEEAYYWLIHHHQALGQLAAAEEATWNLIAWRLGKPVDELQWEDLFDEENALSLHIYVPYHYLANIYQKRFKEDPTHEQLLKRAFRMYQFIDTLIFANLDSYDEEAWLTATKSYNSKIFKSAVETCYALHLISANSEVLDWANHFIERRKAMLFFRDFLSNLKNSGINTPDSLLNRDKELKRAIYDLGKRDNYKKKETYRRLRQQQEIINRQISQSHPSFQQLRIRQPFVALEAVQSRISKDRNVVFNYLEVSSAYYLMFIHPDTVIFTQIQYTNETAESLRWLSRYLSGNESTFNKSSVSIYKNKGYFLFEQFIKPTYPYLKDFSELIIIPDGALHAIAFDALLSDTLATDESLENFQYMLRDYQINYAVSLKSWMLGEAQKSIPTAPSILAYAFSKSSKVFANVLRSEAAKVELPGTAAELKGIEEAFLQSHEKLTLRYGQDASLEHFLEDSKEAYDILHFALHAKSAPYDRLNQVIYFPGNPIDSILGYQLIDKKLNAKLAVLAACQTASGTFELGEGLYSLSRMFLMAGIQEVISSLWEIDDESTSQLIILFYRNLGQGYRPTDALYQAKQAYLRTSVGYRAHPFFWSGLSYWVA